MAEKHSHRSKGAKPGGYKHTAKPATLRAVLGAYGLKMTDYKRVEDLVSKHLGKEFAHPR